MTHHLKKWHIVLMSFITLFVAVFASLFSLRADTVDDETGEVLTDNWELGIVFYDSTIDNGTTPLTEIDWDASNGSYGSGTPRVITVQINYKNTSAVTTYQPGELIITIPNLIYSNSAKQGTAYNAQWSTSMILGANDATHSGYDWSWISEWTPDSTISSFNLTNAKTIEEKTNFEGSIKMIYTINPISEFPEEYVDSCIHNYDIDFKATLKSKNSIDDTKNFELSSNTLSFKYTRTYLHPWKKGSATIEKTASKISSLDGFPQGDYFWIKYKFEVDGHFSSTYPYIRSTFYITDIFPTECIVLDKNLTQLNLENGYYQSSVYNSAYDFNQYYHLYVGYPKSIYNEENNNLNITNNVDLYMKYNTENNYFLAASDDITLNLTDYIFEYSGNLYGINKYDSPQYTSQSAFRYQDIIKDIYYNERRYVIYPSAIYTNKPMTLKFGDDVLFASDNDTYKKVDDADYYFTNIQLTALKDGNSQVITKGKYDCELWIRYAGQEEYILYEEFKNGNDKNWNFTKENHVVAFYFIIKDMEESLKSTSVTALLKYIDPNIETKGELHNFAYLQVYFKDSNGNLILQNEPTIDSYASFNTQNLIAPYDLETYGNYMQRSTGFASWEYYNLKVKSSLFPSKTTSALKQDIENEEFTGKYTVSSVIKTDMWHLDYFRYVSIPNEKDTIKGFIMYDLLPIGMKLTSTKEQILNSINIDSAAYWKTAFTACDSNGITFDTFRDFISHIKENTEIEIIENYNNTGRTFIKIITNLSENPICCFSSSGYADRPLKINFSFDYSISYDAFLEYGSVWKNYVYLEYINKNENQELKNDTYDNGKFDADAIDINNNGQTTDYIAYSSRSTTITSIVSTHQDVTTYVKTDQSSYSTGIVDASNNSKYEYKLRVRTGAADVTNLIIYTNLEEAQQGKTRWKGSFLSLDTTYAENKGYIVKPYYSENPQASNLYNVDGTLNADWKEYIPDTPEIIANGLAITFDENFKTYNSSDFLYIYYYYDNQLYRSPSYYNVNLAGKTIEIPSTDVYFYWYSNSSGNNAYGFKVNEIKPKVVNTTLGYSGYSLPITQNIELTGNNYPETNHNPYNNNEQILWHYTYTGNLILQEYVEHIPKNSIKSLAFEYLNTEGNKAVLPANSLTYVLINMKSPVDENIKTLARMDCRTQWTALDEFDRPVDFITGINSNVVKVALPNSVDEDSVPNISLRFIKEIQGTDTEFENMKLNKAAQQTFMIRLTNLAQNEDGTYNRVTAVLKNNQELIISRIPIGTYLLEELGDNYFDFVDFTNNNDPEIIIEGVTLEKTLIGYILTVSEDLTENIEFNIKVTNEIEDERFYEYKENKENLFLKNKIEENS